MSNAVVVVTGGSGLIGKSILQELKKQDFIAINADINCDENLNDLQFKCDITSKESVDHLVKNVIKKYHRIDGLVNNAYPRTKDWGNVFEKIDLESWKKNVDWQLNSHFYISQAVSAQMKEQKSGSIVNIASIYGVVGPNFNVYKGTELTCPAAYSAIKAGLIGMTRYLASYLGESNIRVNCVSPGGLFDNQNEKFVRQYVEQVPLKRMANPEDISPLVAFLLSEKSKYITGQNIAVDGGWTSI